MAESKLLISVLVNISICCWLIVVCRAEEVVVGSPPMSLLSDPNRQNARVLLPQSSQLSHLRAMEAALRQDDDHSNIDLDKLNEIHRYGILPAASYDGDSYAREDGNPISTLSNLFAKMLRANELVRDQLDRKRSIRKLAALKEDKDYSFVGSPLLMNKLSAQQQLQMAAHKLRDIYRMRGSQYRLAADPESAISGSNHNMDRLSQVNFRPLTDRGNNNIEANEGSMRDKRRRCKVDPNLGVKNPSSCDTDAYFGAADYSVGNVWDLAGRR